MLRNFAQTIAEHLEMIDVHLFQRIVDNKMHLDLNLAKIMNKMSQSNICSCEGSKLTFKKGSARIIWANKLLRNSSGSFSSHVNPVTELNLSSNCLSFITRSARTNKLFRNGFTISSLNTF